MRRLFGTVFLSFIAFCYLTAQEEIGLRTSNFSGIHGAQLNPAFSNSSFFKWDVNVISGGFFIYNGYQYVENSNLIHAGLNSSNLTFNSTDPEEIASQPANPLYYQFTDATKKFDIASSGFFMGPSFSIRFKNLSLGLFLNSRMAFGANRLDPDVDNESLDKWQFLETKFFDPMDAAALIWSEIGFNISGLLKKNRKFTLDGGLNLKYNLGFDGFYVKSSKRIKALAILDTLQHVNGGPLEYGIATGMARDNSGYSPGVNGTGFGIDVGINYIRKSFDDRPYKWKIGASVVDLGYVKFTNNAELHYVPQDTGYITNYKKLFETLTIEKITAEMSHQIYGDSSASRIGSQFTVYTPVGLSIQGDYALSKKWFWGGLISHRMDFSSKIVERENIFMTSLRYEVKAFEMGVSAVLYNYLHPRTGAWVRIGPLTIGTDNFGSVFIKQRQLTGTDFYFAIKVNHFASKRKSKDRFETCFFRK